MSLARQAEQMREMGALVLDALADAPGSHDIQVVMGALGAVVGSMALASGRPEEAIAQMVEVARAVVSGELLHPA